MVNIDHNIAGTVANCLNHWKTLTSCPWVLEAVQGVAIPFTELPHQFRKPFPFSYYSGEKEIIQLEIQKLEKKGVIVQTLHIEEEFLSNVFLRPKPNGDFRMILDLTKLNDFVEYQHFKMFSFSTARDFITPNCWMATIDLKDAYYSVAIRQQDRKFLRFQWEDKLYEYTCLPNGLAVCPRVFTKLLKPIFSKLGAKGHTMFPYIDDVFVLADNKSNCQLAVEDLQIELECSGFQVHTEKSVLTPTNKIKFLGFYLDSVKMEVSLTQDKILKFREIASELLEGPRRIKIRKVAALIGLMTAYAPALLFGGVHIKTLEIQKNAALARNRGNFERFMSLSEESKQDINWWLQHLMTSPNPIRIWEAESTVVTDASMEGWGAHLGSVATGGRWLEDEKQNHINVLELRAILIGLQSLVYKKSTHIRILTDNTTAMAYIRKMGGTRSSRCNELSKLIWQWAEERQNWLSVAHIPGSLNTIADYKSRNFHDHLEWSLNPEIFYDSLPKLGNSRCRFVCIPKQ